MKQCVQIIRENKQGEISNECFKLYDKSVLTELRTRCLILKEV